MAQGFAGDGPFPGQIGSGFVSYGPMPSASTWSIVRDGRNDALENLYDVVRLWGDSQTSTVADRRLDLVREALRRIVAMDGPSTATKGGDEMPTAVTAP